MVSSTRPENLKRVYTGITLTRDDITRLYAGFRDSGFRTIMHANSFQLFELSELDAVMEEDHLINLFTLTAELPREGGSGQMQLIFDAGYVQLEADDSSWTSGFSRVAHLLDVIPRNGTTRCSVSLRRRAVRASLPPSEPSPALERLAPPASATPAPAPGSRPASAGVSTLTPVTGAQAVASASPSSASGAAPGSALRSASQRGGTGLVTPQLPGGRLARVLDDGPARPASVRAAAAASTLRPRWMSLGTWLTIDACWLAAVGLYALLVHAVPSLTASVLFGVAGIAAMVGTTIAATTIQLRR